ncbi:hypothetical protein QBC35DRAFT_393435 [Podospora australis]|uniref:MYND-type domain-containing protein n=1 Tax=Podospora australis TaxID=1536484 RepID=A0AAN7AEI3_9PEZI|nr:hypothetical protein QBC35DRAFT_393435 [Podospora australis]
MASRPPVVFEQGLERDFPKMIPKHCEICKKTEGLQRCAACSVYYYCSREHQTQDWSTHKSTCKQISGARKKVEEEKAKIPDAVFEERKGRCWAGNPDFRPYMKARYFHGELLIRSWRRQGIEDALENYLGMVHLNRGDNQSARDSVPPLYIRLGKDQDAYDFCKWWGLKEGSGQDKHYNWADTTLPFLNIQGADAAEPCDDFFGYAVLRLTHLLSAYLIKFRLLQCFKALGMYKKIWQQQADTDELPTKQEILEALKDKPFMCYGDAIDHQPVLEIFQDENLFNKKTQDLMEQMMLIWFAVNEYNEHMWPMLTSPDERTLSTNPMPYTPGSWAEANIAFANTYSAWVETAGSIPALRKVMENVRRQGM